MGFNIFIISHIKYCALDLLTLHVTVLYCDYKQMTQREPFIYFYVGKKPFKTFCIRNYLMKVCPTKNGIYKE